MRVSWVVFLVACGGASPTRPAPAPLPAPNKTIDPHAAVVARARADAHLHQGVPLDYARPFAEKALDRSATAQLFGDACKLGDKHACIVESQLTTGSDRFHSVEANCVEGDQSSCQALPLDESVPRFPKAAGSMSRRVECQKPTLAAPCDVAALHAECAAGFPVACDELQHAEPEQPMSAAEMTSWPRLSFHGCQDGVASDCLNAYQYGTASDQLDVAQRACELRPEECYRLAGIQADHKETGARDSFERSCQYGGADGLRICLALGASYLDGTYQEPVPGRGQALIDWVCPKLAKGDRERLPACHRATAH